jgi:hypothetical protein
LWIGFPEALSESSEISLLQHSPRVGFKFPGEILQQVEMKVVNDLYYLILGTKAFTVHLLAIDLVQPFSMKLEDAGYFLKASSSLHIGYKSGSPTCFTAKLTDFNVFTSCDFLIGLNRTGFLRARYPVENNEVKPITLKTSVIRPPRSFVEVVGSMLFSTESQDGLVSITALEPYLVTLTASGALKVWNIDKFCVLAESQIAADPRIYKTVAKAYDSQVTIAIAYESNETQCISVFNYSSQGLVLVCVLCAPSLGLFYDFDMNSREVVAAWRTSSATLVRSYSLIGSQQSKVLIEGGEEDRAYSILGVTCTEGFSALVRGEFVGLLRRATCQLERVSWLAEDICSRYGEQQGCLGVDAYKSFQLQSLRIEVQGSGLEGALALVRMWRPKYREGLQEFIEDLENWDFPWTFAIALKEALPYSFAGSFKEILTSLSPCFDMASLPNHCESGDAWPNSTLHLLSGSVISLSRSLVESVLDLLTLAKLVQDKPELQTAEQLDFMEELTRTAKVCLATYWGLSAQDRPEAAAVVTMILAERSGDFMRITGPTTELRLAEWTTQATSCIFGCLSLPLLQPSASDTPILLQLLAELGQTKAALEISYVLPYCHPGTELELALCMDEGVGRAGILNALSHDEADVKPKVGSAHSTPQQSGKGSSIKDFMSSICLFDRASAKLKSDASEWLAYLAQVNLDDSSLLNQSFTEYVAQGNFRSAYAVLQVIPGYSKDLVRSLAQLLINHGSLADFPTVPNQLRADLLESVRSSAAVESFSIEDALCCNRYIQEAFDLLRKDMQPKQAFLGFSDLLYALELQTCQYSSAAAAMHTYANKIEYALITEEFTRSQILFCHRVLKDSLLLASVAMNASQDAFFIAAAHPAEEIGQKKAAECELITKDVLSGKVLRVIDSLE